MGRNYTSTILYGLIVLAILIILVGLWIGGKNKLAYSDFNFDSENVKTLISEMETKQKNNQLSTENRYNLAVLNYKANNYSQAQETLQKLINSGTSDSTVLISGFYNLGNSLFKIAEAEQDINKSLQQYQESLSSYRGALEQIEKDRKFFETGNKKADDILHNFLLTKNRIKILADQLKKQKQAEKQKQDPYQLIKQIEANEIQIKTFVEKMQKIRTSREKTEMKENLLKLRKENLDSLEVIKKQLMEQNNQNQKAPLPAVPKTSQKLTI